MPHHDRRRVVGGFAMAQLPDRSRRGLLALSIGLLMIPFSALWLTRFVLFSAIGLINSHAALIAPALAGPARCLCYYFTGRSAACRANCLSRRAGRRARAVDLVARRPAPRLAHSRGRGDAGFRVLLERFHVAAAVSEVAEPVHPARRLAAIAATRSHQLAAVDVGRGHDDAAARANLSYRPTLFPGRRAVAQSNTRRIRCPSKINCKPT